MQKLFLLTAVFTVVITAHAQISGGLKAGLNLSTFGGDVQDAKIKSGFHLGGYMNIGLNKKLSFQPELLISTAGAKVEVNRPGFSLESITRLTYLSVPLSFQYSFGDFNVHVGPQLSFIMSDKAEYTTTYIDSNGNTVEEVGEGWGFLKDVDLGLNFGVGFNFGRLGASARYSLGLINVGDPAVSGDGASKITNNVIQISAMYKLFGN
jgi:hypothetical protein